MTLDLRVKFWASPLSDKRTYLLENLNRELQSLRGPVLRFGDLQCWQGNGEELLVFYHAFAQRRTKSEKTLFLGPGRCADEIGMLDFSRYKKSILEWPNAAALCFALAELDMDLSGGSGMAENGPCDELGGY